MLIRIADALNDPRLAHGFFGRPGGVSTGVYAGLNCGPGSGDDRLAVIENRRRAAEALGGGALITCYQIHSATVVSVTAPWEIGEAPHADAMVTDRPGLVLGILTADCAPVLFADAEAGVIGAAHAGWKGAIGGVTDATLAAMETLGANRSRITAAIGPCIAQESYEVSAPFRDTFLAETVKNDAFFVPSDRAGHFRFALAGYVLNRLRAAGVAHASWTGDDTYPHAEDFFSFRRATHRGETDYGRDLSAIVLR